MALLDQAAIDRTRTDCAITESYGELLQLVAGGSPDLGPTLDSARASG